MATTPEAARTELRRPQTAERRAQLVRAAGGRPLPKGWARVSLATIAQQTGVSNPTAFLYFRDREALLKAIIEEVDHFYRTMSEQCHDAGRPPMKRIYEHLFTFLDSIDSERAYAVAGLEWSTHFRNEYGLWDAFIEFQEFVILRMAKSVRQCQQEGSVDRGVSASDSGRLIVAGAYALTQLKLVKRRRAVIVSFLEQMLRQAPTLP
jgi:AcrR family transcriptional regulator